MEELEKHMKSMRTTYSKLLDDAPSGSEALDSFRPREKQLFEVLRFLHPHIVKRASKSNIPAKKKRKPKKVCSNEERCQSTHNI